MGHALDSGFTLLELLISITLTGVILVIILGAFSIGIRAWETGEKDIAVHQRQQVVLPLVCRQLSSACWRQIQREDEPALYLGGGPLSVEFISSVAIIPGHERGNVYVKYRVVENKEAGESLEVFEQETAGIKPGTVLFEADEDAFHELFPGAYRIRFEYLKKEAQMESRWQDQWEPEVDAGLPAAVRITLQMDENTAPVTVIARLPSEQP
jgi:general secretion pathway protein J